MGLTDLTAPDHIEVELMKLVPQHRWTFFGPAMVLLGRYVCTSRQAKCSECVMNDVCGKRFLEAQE
jgi:endonuclease III